MEVPNPSRMSSLRCAPTLARLAPRLVQSPNQINTPMQTTLFTMGAQATATKRRRVLSSAVARAKNP